jgi:hypothetical protein
VARSLPFLLISLAQALKLSQTENGDLTKAYGTISAIWLNGSKRFAVASNPAALTAFLFLPGLCQYLEPFGFTSGNTPSLSFSLTGLPAGFAFLTCIAVSAILPLVPP